MSTGIIRIRDNDYETVALRVRKFRDSTKDHRIVTTIIKLDDKCVVMRAEVMDPSGNILATGHAEEVRSRGQINRDSALENCETSAIGRALACYGLGGTQFASADEMLSKTASRVERPPRRTLGDLMREWLKEYKSDGEDKEKTRVRFDKWAAGVLDEPAPKGTKDWTEDRLARCFKALSPIGDTETSDSAGKGHIQ